jgi:predicted GNAT family acetyltransferase
MTLDVEDYAAAAVSFLEAEPCSRNVLRWMVELARARTGGWTAPATFWWFTQGRHVRGAASWGPPFNLQVSTMPEDAAVALVHSVAQHASRVRQPVAGVSGPRPPAAAVATAWQTLTGQPATVRMAQLLHELDAVNRVPQPRGYRRTATMADVDLVARWYAAFADEVGVPMSPDLRAMVRAMLAGGRCHLWCDGDSVVSMAARRVAMVGVVRVGPVYTPPEHRGNGYARRLVADLSAEALAEPGVRKCMLFADVDNPVSNSIYQQIGYVPREEYLDVGFGDPHHGIAA